MEIIYNFRILAYRLMTGYTIQISGHAKSILHHVTDIYAGLFCCLDKKVTLYHTIKI